MLVLQRSCFLILSICCKVITGSRYLFSSGNLLLVWWVSHLMISVVKCPGIKGPSHGMVVPSSCKQRSGVNYDTDCSFTCNTKDGYQLDGPRRVSCLENGSWSGDTSKIRCKGMEHSWCNVHTIKSELNVNCQLDWCRHLLKSARRQFYGLYAYSPCSSRPMGSQEITEIMINLNTIR